MCEIERASERERYYGYHFRSLQDIVFNLLCICGLSRNIFLY